MTLLEALLTNRSTTILRHVACAVVGIAAALVSAIVPDIASIPPHIPNALFAFFAVFASLWGVCHLAFAVNELHEVQLAPSIASESASTAP